MTIPARRARFLQVVQSVLKKEFLFLSTAAINVLRAAMIHVTNAAQSANRVILIACVTKRDGAIMINHAVLPEPKAMMFCAQSASAVKRM